MIDDKQVYDLIKSFADKLPHFSDGRIDYTDSDTAPVVTVFVTFKGKVLLLKRSNDVLTYKGKWNTVAGYLDDLKPLQEKIFEELSEELGITTTDIKTIHVGKPYTFTDSSTKKRWIVHPANVELTKKITIKLDWEHIEYRWIDPIDIDQYDTVPNALVSLKRALQI